MISQTSDSGKAVRPHKMNGSQVLYTWVVGILNRSM